jgi:glycogen synthase
MMFNKIKTVIASVLKPVDDTRMYEKFGLSLQQTNRYAVNIIGFVSKNPPDHKDIRFFPLYNFGNSSWKRFFAPFSFGKYLFTIAPSLVIVTTYELLPAAILYKLCHRKIKVVYDVQENYALNYITNRKPSGLTRAFAELIRLLEKKSQRYISLNILAEKSYAKEVSFFSKKSIYILNKFPKLSPQAVELPLNIKERTAKAWPILLFNGTVSENYGIFEVMDLAKKLSLYYPNLLLMIAGHATNTKLLKYLLKLEYEISYLITHVAKDPVPHPEILKLIHLADFGVVAHRPVESIKDCFPTRIYEYMAHKKPFILQNHSYWTSYCDPWQCSINIDFRNFDTDFVAQQLKSNQFYPNGIPTDIYWDSEAVKLIQALDHLFEVNG